MKQITVWTKQHRSVLEQLEKTGRYIARRYRLPDLRGNSRYANRQEEWVCYRRFVNGNV